MVAMVTLSAALLLWRGLDLTLTHKDFLQNQGDARYLRVVAMPAHRGIVLDRNAEPLAVSTPVDSVWVNPGELATQRARWPALARLLDLTPQSIERLLAGRMDREFLYLRRHVEPGLAARVLALKIPGVALQREYRRYYPTGEVCAHVIGFTNVDDVGQEGLELAFDDWLRGTPGAKRVIQDRLGRVVEDVESIEAPRPGRDLVLSLDRRIQYLAYRQLKATVRQSRAKSGSVVVLDARTGEVLAMVNQPAYNPNNLADRVSRRFRNRAVTDVFEPGSSVKPFTVAAGFTSGLFRPDTIIDTTPGLLKVGRYTVHDVHNYGVIDVATLIKKSSNVGASKMSLALPPEALWRMFSGVGFGSLTGSGFPGEAEGILTDYSRWGEITRATLSFGYGLSVTPLQLARAYQALANGGRLLPVSFKRLEAPPAGVQVMSPKIARQVRRLLEGVLADGGTGTHARVAGYRVAGKTGTVKKSIEGGYSDDRYVAVFAGIAPASSPRLVIVAVINEPRGGEYYGGLVAGPLFAEVMGGSLRILGIPPDDRSAIAHHIAMSGEARGAPTAEPSGEL